MRSGTRSRITQAILLATLAMCTTAWLSACTLSFDPMTRPRRDASRDGDATVLDGHSDSAAGDSEAAVVLPDTLDVPVVDALDVASDHADVQVADVQDVGPDSGCGDCVSPRECCGSQCVSTATSPQNCGACGIACPGTTCVGASCTSTCLLGFADCDRNGANGCEADIRSNNMNCGACGVACPSGRACVVGVCTCVAGTADCDANPVNGCEANIATDPMRCGGCGTTCMPNQVCAAGVCGCAPGYSNCDGVASNGCEADTRTSSRHCGGCGIACGLNNSCVAGACVCAPGFLRCASGSLDCSVSATDPANCMMCGVVCADPTPACSSTGCATGCAEGESRCSSSCANTDTDPANCGACGNLCPSGAHANANCSLGACRLACNPGFENCDGMDANGCEVEISSANANCGACGVVCGTGRSCIAGVCACPTGLRDCGGTCAACCTDGQCADSDPCTADSCAAGTCVRTGCATGLTCCGSACRSCCGDSQCTAVPGRGCGLDGTCSVCLSGLADCDLAAANGCEVDTRTSLTNCGGCGAACSFANASASCTNGTCSLGACNAGFANCDGLASNGCEVNTTTSTANCGACGTVCSFAGAEAVCSAGVCLRSTCDPGRGDCDAMTSTGCETDITTSTGNCGACANVCAFANAGASCVASMCALGTCDSGFANCDGNAANGCETSTSTSVANCGGCGMNCAPPMATGACSAGVCGVASCVPGRGNCDAMAANGCETDTATDLAHCGSCGSACPVRANAVRSCSSGTCGFTCNAGFEDCDGDPANGCEADLGTSRRNCGACGVVCNFANATATCNAGVCSLGVCNAGFGNCDAVAANGCEVPLTTSPSNCGACMNVCMLPHALPSCAASTCNANSCGPGYNDCNTTVADGCEINCGAARSCTTGACTSGWLALARTAAPSARAYAFSVVAPSRHELIVWGGRDGTGMLRSGARYNWDTNTWAPMAAAPLAISARAHGTAVWTGTEFFVWGGRNTTTSFNNGALYNPQTDSWRLIATDSNTPSPRAGYTAWSTPTGILIQGGQDISGSAYGDGAVYSPGANSWRRISGPLFLAARTASVWTGSRLAVFGGADNTNCGNVGTDNNIQLLDPAAGSGSWALQIVTGRPMGRYFESLIDCVPYAWPAIWTGTEMVVFGGLNRGSYQIDGFRWRPGDAAARAVATPPAPLAAGFLPVWVWTGSRILGWSEAIAGSAVNVVYTYDPVADTWTQSVPAGAPPAVYEGAAFGWTGNELIVWGGRTGVTGFSNQGGRYAP